LIEFVGKGNVRPGAASGRSSFASDKMNGTGRPGTRNPQIRLQRWKFLQNRSYRGIGGPVFSVWQGAKPCARCGMSCESNGRIFCINPSEQRAAFFRVGRYECNAGRWRQKCYGSRVNNLEDIKAQGVSHQRQHKESRERRPPPLRRIPAKKQGFGCNLRGNVSHRGRVAASATDLMPCSSAAFVTSATVSYEAERSAFMMIDWSLRLAASSKGPSCSVVTRWS